MKGLKLKLLLVCALVLFVGAPVALGDWDPGDGHKMHYPQLPDPNGWDVGFWDTMMMIPLELADDWQCSQTGPVEDIHFWVSWYYDMQGVIGSATVSIYSNDPCGANGYSEPDELLWQRTFQDINDIHYSDGDQGWYDPFMLMYEPFNHFGIYQINITDIAEPFIQEEGQIYWLSIQTNTEGVGWKTSLNHFEDNAAWRSGGSWEELYDPVSGGPLDFAFVITGEPNEPEPEPELDIKWSQPPVLWEDPNIYIGWDEMSLDLWYTMALDDFQCDSNAPVIGIRWWGSFEGYEDDSVDPALLPLGFYITFWDNAPADPCDPCSYSHPSNLIHEIYCYNYTVDFYGWELDAWFADPCYPQPPLLGKFEFNQVLDPCDYWEQPGEEGIYWLGIMALYDDPCDPCDPCEPMYPWGWETRPHYFEDDAVILGTDPRFDPWGNGPYPADYFYPIKGPYNETWDLSFELLGEIPEEPVPPKEPVPNLKWSQPPIEWDPNDPEPRFCGWDEPSYTNDPCGQWWVAADDFRCFGSMPITSVHWWGSHIGWDGDEPPPADELPTGWRIGFWTNVAMETVAVDVVDYSAGQPGTYFLPPDIYPTNAPYYRWYDEDWGWTHTFSPPNPAPVSINWATLEIKAFDVNGDEYDLITGDGSWLETKHDLDHHHNMQWHTTTFTLDPAALANLMDGTSNIWMDIDSTHDNDTWAVTIEKSTLTVNYVSTDGITPYSHPGQLLWQIEVDAARVPVERVGVDEHPINEGFPETCFQYYVDLEPEEVFWQEEFLEDTHDDVFWISIVAMYPEPTDPCDSDPCHPWGWKTRPWSWMDDAVGFNLYENPQPGMVIDPCSNNTAPLEYEGESYDLAFELDTDPNWIKWDQPYTGFRHWPHYEDIESWMEWWPEGPAHWKVAADDWKCQDPEPVTALAWWGSYLGYEYQPCDPCFVQPQPEQPAYFDVSIWTDVPADPCDPCSYSHPDIKVWQYNVYNFDEVLVGYDKHPEDPCGITGHEPVFRYTARIPPENWFWQDEAEQVYWLMIVAVYEEHYPEYEWGWTNHQHVYNDDAVQANFDPVKQQGNWYEILDQTGASADLSFTIYTDPYAEQPVEEIDFGDAPDLWPVGEGYPTLLGNNGASHSIVPGLYLGNGIDAELDGQPDPCALGDDNDGNDDEDGVVFTSRLIPGQQATVDVTASASGFLNAWMDFNADGDWADPGERIFNDVSVIAGVNSLIFQIPASTPGHIQTFARFRFTSTGSLWFPCWENPRQCHGDADGMAWSGMVWVFVPDVDIFMAAYPSTYPTPPYDACADFDRDGDVDLGDQAILMTWYGVPVVPADCPITGVNFDYYGPTDDGEVEDYRVFIEAIDFGDAPAPYPTLLANNGAMHVIGGPWLGDPCDAPDHEGDGQPHPQALGDDNDAQGDDEDGVTIPVLHQGHLDYIIIEVSDPCGVGGWVELWIDYNDDGDWNDADELVTSAYRTPGTHMTSDIVPLNAVVGQTFARCRISTGGPFGPTGLANDGEVEDYEVTIEPTLLDFGDAPDPNYPTLLANNGARHVITGYFPWLGDATDAPDAEADGQPDPCSMGDDNDGQGDDEDGVVFTSALVPGQLATVDVTAKVSVVVPLNAWVDFNGDGDWADPCEQIFTDEPVSDGLNSLNFQVPASATPNIYTHARFRIDSAGGLSYTGQADDGEVEDYMVHIEYKRKWSQPPVEIEPGIYYGWDEPSIYDWMQIVADDWACEDWRPVSDIHWWGSHYAWTEPVPPEPAPVGFHIGIWTNVKAGVDLPYSHPGKMIWEYNAVMADLNVEFVGEDSHPDHPDDACFRYDLQIPEEAWYWQDPNYAVYWLSISAIYDPGVEPEMIAFPWGWKTREHYFEDDAVRIWMPSAPVVGVEFIEGEPILPGWDMAFELTTQECMAPTHPDYATWASLSYPSCWCYSTQCKGNLDGLWEITGTVAVFMGDLPTFLANFGVQFVTTVPGICANLDHLSEITGTVPVFMGDLPIFLANFGVQFINDCSGPGCDAPGCDTNPLPNLEYNFWTSP